jgi:hypothetical protein
MPEESLARLVCSNADHDRNNAITAKRWQHSLNECCLRDTAIVPTTPAVSNFPDRLRGVLSSTIDPEARWLPRER